MGARTARAVYALLLAGAELALIGCASNASPGPLASGRFSTVLIDAGHGGQDSGGASGRRGPVALREKDLTLDTAKRVRDALRRSGLRPVMTRTDDHFVPLDERVRMANRLGAGAVLVSIHYNATAAPGPNGAETFYWRADSHALATRIQRQVIRRTQETDVGVTRRRLRLTRNPKIPCVLIECAYLTNPSDNRRVAETGARQRIADGIAAGLLEQSRLGNAGILPVPEIWAPPSQAADGRSLPKKRHRRVHQRLRRAETSPLPKVQHSTREG